MNPVRERAIEQLRHIVLNALADYDAAVWLCGSCARGDVRQPDDIDVAIFPRDELPTSFFAELAAELEESAIPYYVDVLDCEMPTRRSSMTFCGRASDGATDPGKRRVLVGGWPLTRLAALGTLSPQAGRGFRSWHRNCTSELPHPACGERVGVRGRPGLQQKAADGTYSR